MVINLYFQNLFSLLYFCWYMHSPHLFWNTSSSNVQLVSFWLFDLNLIITTVGSPSVDAINGDYISEWKTLWFTTLQYKFLDTHRLHNQGSQQDYSNWPKIIKCRKVCLLDRYARGNYMLYFWEFQDKCQLDSWACHFCLGKLIIGLSMYLPTRTVFQTHLAEGGRYIFIIKIIINRLIFI